MRTGDVSQVCVALFEQDCVCETQYPSWGGRIVGIIT